MYRNFTYLLSLLPAVLCIVGNLLGGWWVMMNIVFSIIILPLLDITAGKNTSNQRGKPNDMLPDVILILHVIAHSFVVFSLFYSWNAGILINEFVWLAVAACGYETGSGAVVVAHELVHKALKWKRLCGQWLLLLAGNVYFKVHHLRIHHRDVGLPEDAATARKGETLYAFFIRTVPMQFSQGWQSEKSRLEKNGYGAFSFRNELLRNVVYQVLILTGLTIVFSFKASLIWLTLSIWGSLLLEYVNYIEHYGLTRTRGEKVNHSHSWNCDKVVSRFFLIDLSRHADHHYHASKPYQNLDSLPQSPVLPGGYAAMIVPALIPPLWFRLVHPILDSRKNSQ